MHDMKGRLTKTLVLACAAPLLMLYAIELALRLGEWGAPSRLLETVTVDGVDWVKTNPGYLRSVFTAAEVPSPLPVWTTKEKKPGTKRVVLLGESAAAGFPVNDYHLGRLVEVVWHVRHPDTPLEVINLSAVAVDTGVLRAFAREAMMLNPDALILYAGHNEAIGPSFKRASRWRLSLMRTHIGEVTRRLAARLVPSASRPEWTGLNAFRDMNMDFDAAELDAMYRRSANHLREIYALGAPVLVAVPAINLNDWEPGGGAASAEAYREAKALAEQGDRDAAWELYRRAADLDTKRIRADSRVRDLLRSQPATVVDIDRWLHEQNPVFKTDREFFVEHVHLTFAGRVAVAARIVDGLEAMLLVREMKNDPSTWWSEFPRVIEEAARRTMFNGYDEHDMWSLAWKLLRLEVFQDSFGWERRRDELANDVVRLRNRAIRDWPVGRLAQAYDDATTLRPDDPLLHFTAGRLLGLQRSFDTAEQAFRRGFALMPNHSDAWLNYGMMSLARQNLAGAREALERVEQIDPHAKGLAALRAAIRP